MVFPFRAARECNCMSVAKRVRSIVYAPLFHRGCTFALKHMCTEFYDANHARHGTKSCSCCCCVRRWSRFGRITNFKIVFLILSVRPNIRCQFNRETLRFKWIKLYISNMPYPLVGFLLALRHAHSNRDAIRTSARWRPSLRKKFRSTWKMSSIAFSFLWLRQIAARL